eukprot:scaffold14472_cov49-Phaeocystis_antarctica.AAC.1
MKDVRTDDEAATRHPASVEGRRRRRQRRRASGNVGRRPSLVKHLVRAEGLGTSRAAAVDIAGKVLAEKALKNAGCAQSTANGGASERWEAPVPPKAERGKAV